MKIGWRPDQTVAVQENQREQTSGHPAWVPVLIHWGAGCDDRNRQLRDDDDDGGGGGGLAEVETR